MIHVFHGLFGSPDDFKFLDGRDVIRHDLYRLKEISFNPEDVVIGYSMGGRVALELVGRANFKIKKLILISAHPGLATDSEKSERKHFENLVLKNLQTLSKTEFLAWWNKLPIFSSDSPISITEDFRFSEAPALFEKMKLSKQQNYLPELLKHRDKVFWIVGLSDDKYLKLATGVLQPMDLEFEAINGGHRLFQHPDELMRVFKSQGII